MTTFVLVPGAWPGGWCWQLVTPLLEAGGHRVVTPTLTGLGERAVELTPAIGLEHHVQDPLDVLGRSSKPVSLVGHSYAGLVVREVALRAPDRVRELVLVEGWIGAGRRRVQDPDDGAWLRSRLTDHPLKTFTDPTSPEGPLPPTRAILASPGPVPFAEMAGERRIPTQRVDGGHDPMITSPGALARALCPTGSSREP